MLIQHINHAANQTLEISVQTATMVYKSLNGLAPEYLRSKFTDRSDTSSSAPRDCEAKTAIPLPRTNFPKNSYSGAVLWNSLPVRLRQAQTPSSSKSGCRGFFDNNG